MINFAELTDEELDYFIEKATAQGLKKYYQSNPREFGKLIKGFRPETVTDEIAISLAKKYKNKDFISSFIRKHLERWNLEIDDYINQLETRGLSHDAALFRTIPLSVYDGNIGLFFKVREEVISEKELEELEHAIKRYGTDIDIETKEDSPSLKKSKYEALELENNSLREELKTKDELLMSQSAEAEEMQKKLAEREYIASFEDSIPDEDMMDDEYPYLSLCKVYINQYTDKRMLSRIADIDGNDIKRFVQNEDLPHSFENRDQLFWKNGPEEDGTIGVWKWNVTPNINDPSSDYVLTSYCDKIKPIEVIECNQAGNIKDIISIIKEGIQLDSIGNKVFLAYKDSEDYYNGILLQSRDLISENGLTRLKEDIVAVPEFRVPDEECIYFNGRVVYKHLGMGSPQSVCKTKNPIELVKALLMERASISELRQKGLSRKEAQSYQQILKEMNGKSLVDEYAEKYKCTEEEAKKYIDSFINAANEYLTGDDFDTYVLSEAIQRNDELVKKCMLLLENEWTESNQSRINEANRKIEALDNEIKRRKEEIKGTEDDYQKYKKELEERENFAAQIENRITQKVKNTQTLLADLLGDATIYSPVLAAIRGEFTTSSVSMASDNNLLVLDNANEEYTDEADFELIDDVETFKDELADVLISEGYERDGAIELASTIAFCIQNRLPVLCRTNGELIADCVARLYGKKKATLVNIPIGFTDGMTLRGVFTSNQERKVFYISGLFDGFSSNLFNTLMLNKMDWPDNSLLIISIEGISITSISESVFDNALLIDSDIDYCGEKKGDSGLYKTSFVFEQSVLSKGELKESIKELKPFEQFTTNKAQRNYAALLHDNEQSLADSYIVLTQLIARVVINGRQNELEHLLELVNLTAERKNGLLKYIGA